MLTAVGIALSGLWRWAHGGVQRLSRKLDLIERVDQRLKAPPSPCPLCSGLEVTAAAYEYPARSPARPVAGRQDRAHPGHHSPRRRLLGADRCKPAKAPRCWSTAGLCPGPSARAGKAEQVPTTSASTPATVVGLLRMSEAGGGFSAQQRPAAALAFARCSGHCAGAATGTPSAFLCGRRPASLKAPRLADLPGAKRPWPREGADGGALLFQQPPGVCADLVWIGTDGGGGCGGCGTHESRLRAGLPQPHHP